jgi:hypothetical protein
MMSEVSKPAIDKRRPMDNCMRELQAEDHLILKIATNVLRHAVYLVSVVIITRPSEVRADEDAKICGSGLSVLNEGKNFEEFDKQNGGGEKRLRFRSTRRCVANECGVEIVAGAPAAEKVIATITGRMTSDCVYGLNRVHIAWNRRRSGCPSSYLWNALGIIVAEDGRDVKIEYV